MGRALGGRMIAAILFAAMFASASSSYEYDVPVGLVDVVVLVANAETSEGDARVAGDALRYVERGPHDPVDARFAVVTYDPRDTSAEATVASAWTRDAEVAAETLRDIASRAPPDRSSASGVGVGTGAALRALTAVVDDAAAVADDDARTATSLEHARAPPPKPSSGPVPTGIAGRRSGAHLHVILLLPHPPRGGSPAATTSAADAWVDSAAMDVSDVMYDPSRITIAAVVDPRDSAAVRGIGDPAHEDAYPNGAGFNMRGTLDAIRSAESEDSLQALLLKRGCEVRVLRAGAVPGPHAMFTGRGVWHFAHPASAWRVPSTFRGKSGDGGDSGDVGCVETVHHGCVAPRDGEARARHAAMLRALWRGEVLDDTAEDITAVADGGDWHGKGIYALRTEPGLFSDAEVSRARAARDAGRGLLLDDRASARPGAEGRPREVFGDRFAGPPDPEDPTLPASAARVKVEEWDPSRPFDAADILAKRTSPVILRNTVVSTWPALDKWKDPAYFAAKFGRDREARDADGAPVLEDVKVGTRNPFFDPDAATPMSSFPTVDVDAIPYDKRNATVARVVDEVLGPAAAAAAASATDTDMYYYYGELGEALLDDIRPYSGLFSTDDDAEARRQFLWISSGRKPNRSAAVPGGAPRGGAVVAEDDGGTGGVELSNHFDQDANMYTQLVGRKRFVLFTLDDHERLALFPRIGPMWHKSSVPLRQRARALAPGAAWRSFRGATPYVADLGPGDVLVIPRMTFHCVKLIDDSPSVSMATWNHDWELRKRLFMVYRRRRPWEDLLDPAARRYALRLYIDLMAHEIVGRNATSVFAGDLLRTRYRAVMPDFPRVADDPSICPDKIPGNPGLFRETRAGVLEQDAPRFRSFPGPIRDVLFADFVEEMAAEVVGAEYVPAFLNYCFRPGQGYITDSKGTLADWGPWGDNAVRDDT